MPQEYDQARYGAGDGDRYEPLLNEKGHESIRVQSSLPDDLTRDELELPALSEPEIAKHYTRLSQMNWGVDSGAYPLGSCTMKYNPKFVEGLANRPDAAIHPDRDPDTVQGTLQLLYELQDHLATIGGMDAVSLQPPAGAAGEFTGIRIAAAHHEHNGESHRDEIIIPEGAHGTNFASAAMGGYEVVEVPTNDAGRVDVDALDSAAGENTAALMLTNPNTLGVFETNITKLADVIHDAGGLLYYDGANLNALLGQARPGDMGFDVMHYNVHKTFATPHGGGGPGAGPLGVTEELADYLPRPQVVKSETGYDLRDPARSIGKVHGHHGNWLVLLKAYAYILRLGDEGLLDASEKAVLNANYLAEQIDFEIPYEPFHHEFVATAGD
ncbi:MAG: aminomethyl-transferring glycine dehydrogenase subunit GcvPB, partial [Halobacteriaceae archaeon]